MFLSRSFCVFAPLNRVSNPLYSCFRPVRFVFPTRPIRVSDPPDSCFRPARFVFPPTFRAMYTPMRVLQGPCTPPSVYMEGHPFRKSLPPNREYAFWGSSHAQGYHPLEIPQVPPPFYFEVQPLRAVLIFRPYRAIFRPFWVILPRSILFRAIFSPAQSIFRVILRPFGADAKHHAPALTFRPYRAIFPPPSPLSGHFSANSGHFLPAESIFGSFFGYYVQTPGATLQRLFVDHIGSFFGHFGPFFPRSTIFRAIFCPLNPFSGHFTPAQSNLGSFFGY